MCEYLETQAILRVPTVHGLVEVRGRIVEVGGRRASLAPGPLVMFRALAAAGGNVLARTDLAGMLPDDPDDHAVDVAVSRLRRALPVPSLVATVIKRGYRLDV